MPVEDIYNAEGPADFAMYWPVGGHWFVRQGKHGAVLENWEYEDPQLTPHDLGIESACDVTVCSTEKGTWYIRYNGGRSCAQTWGGHTI